MPRKGGGKKPLEFHSLLQNKTSTNEQFHVCQLGKISCLNVHFIPKVNIFS